MLVGEHEVGDKLKQGRGEKEERRASTFRSTYRERKRDGIRKKGKEREKARESAH